MEQAENVNKAAGAPSGLNVGLGVRDLYSMPAHDCIFATKNTEVLRVPGGWVYISYIENGIGGYDISSCFVPFNNEFQTVPNAQIKAGGALPDQET